MNRLIGHTENVAEELCGLLLGRLLDEETGEVSDFVRVSNSETKDRQHFYLISTDDYLRAERIALESNLEILGVYHTHLNYPPIPSETDKRFAFPGFFYLILSMIDYKYLHARCWRMTEMAVFMEEEIRFYS
ncbi:MAG: Mov34/MPN/PAD-1 family protein [Lunatimonas sp.]|uniref:Mov34/MPN/PAD-1 family protein n=1 Tax=Lunatimonas sp. TaxID=2060141 RepID=UPI00263B912C|nr:Mov34/MPN/PAD-1 family protein [Lunatimonas sp.]MCC5937647.1 Mov34/MPN/PAD-1 family protein [Lunatimonas sp.]